MFYIREELLEPQTKMMLAVMQMLDEYGDTPLEGILTHLSAKVEMLKMKVFKTTTEEELNECLDEAHELLNKLQFIQQFVYEGLPVKSTGRSDG